MTDDEPQLPRHVAEAWASNRDELPAWVYEPMPGEGDPLRIRIVIELRRDSVDGEIEAMMAVSHRMKPEDLAHQLRQALDVVDATTAGIIEVGDHDPNEGLFGA